jgi:phage-related tail protein
MMRAARLQNALEKLTEAMRDVENEVAENEGGTRPSRIAYLHFAPPVSNRQHTKSGKRREVSARLSYDKACDLGFRGSLDEWERLMGAAANR